jgi:hypothetical protein
MDVSAPQYESQKLPTLEETALRVLALVLILAFIGPLTLLVSVWFYTKVRLTGFREARLVIISVLLVAIFVFAVWPRTSPHFTMIANGLENGGREIEAKSFLVAWVSTALLVPAGVVVMGIFERLYKLLRGRTIADWIRDEEKDRAKLDARLSGRAVGREKKEPARERGHLRLGPYIKGDVFPSALGVMRESNWISIAERLLDQHMLLIGTTGAGKSEAIKRLALEILSTTDRDLFLVDGKGDDELALAIRALAIGAGRAAEVPIFRLGSVKTGAVYDGFKGDAHDIYSRLAAMIGVSEAEGGAQYYADINRGLLQLVCYVPQGPPRSFEQLRLRLNLTWLKSAWADDPIEIDRLRNLKASGLEGLALRLDTLAREFNPIVGPEGFCLENTGCAIFSIRTQSVSDAAARFLSFLVEDLKDFAGKRQKRPGVLIVDEFGAFGNNNIIALLTMARSAKLGIILATQDIASLGDEGTRRLILANTRTKILMATDFPEEVATLAGTVYQVESSIQHEGGAPTGMGSARIQHAFKVDMNEAARLQAGEGFLIRQRYAAKFRVSAIKGVPDVPPEPTYTLRDSQSAKIPGAEAEGPSGETQKPGSGGIDF